MSLLLRLLLALCMIAPAAFGQAGDLQAARERWERLSNEERARLSERFDEFRNMPEAERERMRAHLARIAEARREIEASIPAQTRARLDGLDEASRRQVLREYVELAMSERAERLRAKMSPDLCKRLEGASLSEREALLRERRGELHERGAPRVIDYLGRKLDLPGEEIERLKGLPAEQRAASIEALSKRELARRGPPPGVSPEEYQRWLELPPREMFECLHRRGVRGFGPDRGGPPDRQGAGAARDVPGPGGRDGRLADGPHPEGGAKGSPRGPRREGRIAKSAQAEVWSALRPEAAWVLELAELSRDERREEIGRRARAKAIDVLRRSPEVTAQDLQRLEASSGREFHAALREIAGDPPGRSRGEWGGRGWGGPESRGGPGDGPKGPGGPEGGPNHAGPPRRPGPPRD